MKKLERNGVALGKDRFAAALALRARSRGLEEK